ncbi:hypothetical protein TWF225_000102 [Orbilia oligospora]|uniref:Uncharacterized protein n=1 Tax=Orbilia oligospora TaxID=2813651 RepID=A0A7C8PD09_ORBOL|nr:hypothetical protein TWF751_008140 [Orbilia oligospora]KAF3195710.1 hypothetical protein TWF225_000102 [Orbilia oligospora]KAF3256080.1 hypothetical protein TWF128_005514 [Orbilia oligospora]KAF3256081.1 hypothetical protein TWF128_005514 [Orbilia oligospora]KAF3261420.1 hypothetical protein TWF217_004561 [Orbilia oligospora]
MAEMDIDGKSDAESSGEEGLQLPETLIAGRARRSTAGNRLAQLLQQEQPDDIDLLFEEDGDDDDFEAKHESDVDLGSSSDEEDKPQDQDELSGEKKLEQEERAAKRQKRAFPGQKELDKLVKRQQNLREKRVTIQEPDQATKTPTDDENTPRARKKSERISWIPTAEDLPSRQSTRRQTVANKQLIHERMKESNERRLKVIAAMNEASQKKKVEKTEMTQEMRLERAKKVEEINKKSLNKWQEAEEARLEAQRAKLAALHNRKIEGPYIRFYSGRAEYGENGKLITMGRRKMVEELPDVVEVKKPGEKTTDEKTTDEKTIDEKTIDEKTIDEKTTEEKATEEKAAEEKAAEERTTDERATDEKVTEEKAVAEKPIGEKPISEKPVDENTDSKSTDAPATIGIKELDEDVVMEDAPQVPASVEKPRDLDTNGTGLPEPIASAEPSTQQQPSSLPTTSQVPTYALVPSDADGSSDDTQHKIAAQLQGDLDASISPSKPQVSSQTYIVLEGFTKRELNNKDLASKVLFPHNNGPLPKPERPLCVTTSLPARYKDPSTGLPYASLFAYKQIQRVKAGGLQWNNELQCFFDVQEAASGVPEGFND